MLRHLERDYTRKASQSKIGGVRGSLKFDRLAQEAREAKERFKTKI